MKTIKAVKNFLNVLDESNFVDLYYVEERETGKRRSICFIEKEEAEKQLEYIKRKEPNTRFFIARTCVFFG